MRQRPCWRSAAPRSGLTSCSAAGHRPCVCQESVCLHWLLQSVARSFGSSSYCSLALCSEADRTAAPPTAGAVAGGTDGLLGCAAPHTPTTAPTLQLTLGLQAGEAGRAGRGGGRRARLRPGRARAAPAAAVGRAACGAPPPPPRPTRPGSWSRRPPTACRCAFLSLAATGAWPGDRDCPPLLGERPGRNREQPYSAKSYVLLLRRKFRQVCVRRMGDMRIVFNSMLAGLRLLKSTLTLSSNIILHAVYKSMRHAARSCAAVTQLLEHSTLKNFRRGLAGVRARRRGHGRRAARERGAGRRAGRRAAGAPGRRRRRRRAAARRAARCGARAGAGRGACIFMVSSFRV